MNRTITLVYALFLLVPSAGSADWFKGNTHTHTTLSDGDSPPETVAKWYKDHGYQFVVMTDHNKTGDGGMQARFGEEGRFLVITGNEISCVSEGKPVHLTAVNPSGVLVQLNDSTVVSTLRKNVDAIRAAGATPIINHPNFMWAFGAEEMGKAGRFSLFEIQNSHPMVNNLGGGGKPDTEEMWDALLTKGMRVYGVASDDTHTLKDFLPRLANPGRGWVCVRCDSLTPEAVASALERGNFYTSTGVELEEVASDGKSLVVTVKPAGNTAYTIDFIGRGGKVLARKYETKGAYRITGKEGYVRVRITDSNGFRAWTQPVFAWGK